MPTSLPHRILAAFLLAAIFLFGCSQKRKMSEFIHSKDHHSPVTAQRFELAQQMAEAGNYPMAKHLYALVLADNPDDPVASERMREVLIASVEWNMHKPLSEPRVEMASASAPVVQPATLKAEKTIRLVGPNDEPVAVVDESLRNFAESESALDHGRSGLPVSDPQPPATLTGTIEQLD